MNKKRKLSKKQEIISQLFDEYVKEYDDYLESKHEMIKDINFVLESHGDPRGVICGTEFTEILNKQISLLGINNVKFSL
jgi:hypothetical protein